MEDTVDSDAFSVAKGDRLCPRVALLEEDVFEVGLDERVFNWVAVVIEGLHDFITPRFAQSKRSCEEYLVKLEEQLDYF